jgi:hypothetical protein
MNHGFAWYRARGSAGQRVEHMHKKQKQTGRHIDGVAGKPETFENRTAQRGVVMYPLIHPGLLAVVTYRQTISATEMVASKPGTALVLITIPSSRRLESGQGHIYFCNSDNILVLRSLT